MKSLNHLCAIALLAAATAAHAGAYDPPPLGPFPDTAPTIALHDFAAGHLGVIDGSFQRAYLLAAWRAIGGKPLSGEQARQLSLALSENGSAYVVDADVRPIWGRAIERFGGAVGNKFDAYLTGQRASTLRVEMDGSSSTVGYDNCTADAVRVAVATLTQRATAYGDADHNPWVAEWLRGQKTVFDNCSYGDNTLPAAPADAPPWFRHDRAYQAAAALFYGGRFDEARAAFAAIAADSASPWAELAPYLVARCDLRLGSLSPDGPVRTRALARAEAEFRAVAETSSKQRASARGMLRRIAIERDRAAALRRLERVVGEGAWGADATADAGDFLSLVRLPVWERVGATPPIIDPKGRVVPRDGGLVDWLASMAQSGFAMPNDDRYYYVSKPLLDSDHARACGKLSEAGTHRDAWMIVCYLSAKTPADVPAAVRAAQGNIPDSAPAWATLNFLELSLRMSERAALAAPMSPEESQALRARFDAALEKGDSVFGGDGINALRVLRAPVSASALDLATSTRLRRIGDPQQYPWREEIGRETTNEVGDSSAGVTLLSTSVDVRLMAALANDPAAPSEVRAKALYAAWTRAAMLKQDGVVTSLTPALRALDSRNAADVQAYVDAADPVDKQLSLVRLMRRAGFGPIYGGGDWGCKYPDHHEALAWMDAPDVTAGQAEFDVLSKLPTFHTYYGQAVLALAKERPTDARLPAELASVVASTRMSCQGETPISKAAFKALHRLFPKSPEAARTKYFF